jgi:hypothetical protein
MKQHNIMDTIFDITISYENAIENELEFLNGKFPTKISFYLDTIDCHDEKSMISEEWLYERWRLKDSILQKY